MNTIIYYCEYMVRTRVYRQAASHFLGLFVLSLALLGALTQMSAIQTWLSQATGEPANLVIDTQGITGPLNTPWRYLAQGGESPDYQIAPVLKELTAIKPKAMRLDHLFDYYATVSFSPTGSVQVDWTKLDILLKDLHAASVSPMLALSYMPPALSATGDITAAPNRWSDWSTLVRLTIEHVSGLQALNLPNVYYEVWNEPDLFGGWKAGGGKNYFTLYEQSVLGATAAQNVQPFFLGGPATTSLYPNWLTKFMDYVSQRQLRLDFYSWHIYDPDPQTYLNQLQQFDRLMRQYPSYLFKVEPIITEWGPTSALSSIYDQNLSAAHLVAVSAVLPPTLKQAYLFEFQDGENPQGDTYWGRWGLLTSPSSGNLKKPRYQALNFLNRLGEQALSVAGQGTWVKAIAATDSTGTLKVIVANYDPQDKHTETVPLNFVRVTPGTYTLTTEYLGRPPQTTTLTAITTTLQSSLPLPPNTVVFLNLSSTLP